MSNKAQDTSCSGCGSKIKDHKDRDFIKDSKKGLILCTECIGFFSKAQEQISHAREHEETDPQTLSILPEKLPYPEEIFNMLSEHVIGQDEAKKTMSIAVAHHYRRLKNPSIGKSNILLIGPTGTGKTEMARTIAHFLKVPFVSVDATAFTSKGYVGEDADSSIQRLLSKCDYNVALAERGIVFIDEIDKIARRGADSGGSGVSTVAVQQELLRLMEGDSVKITRPINDGSSEVIYVNTSKILFICSGAFVGLDEIVKKGNSKGIGIQQETEYKPTDLANGLEAKHLTQFGMIPEFLGRLPVIAVTEKLNQAQMLSILKEPKNSIIKQYHSLFAQDNVDLEFSDDFLESVVQEAFHKEIGARGLRQIMEKRMKPVFYRIHDFAHQKVMINKTGFFSAVPATSKPEVLSSPVVSERKVRKKTASKAK